MPNVRSPPAADIGSAKALEGILQEGLHIGRRKANVGLLPVDGALQFACRSCLQFGAQEFTEISSVILPDELDAISRETLHATLRKVEGVLVETRAEFIEADRRFHRSSLAHGKSPFHPERNLKAFAFRLAPMADDRFMGWARGGRNPPTKLDGEIKAPGPFRSMSLVVLRNFRDLVLSQGPGFQDFLSKNNDLSGTNRTGRHDWSRSSR